MKNFIGCTFSELPFTVTQASEAQLENIKCTVQDSGATCPVFFSKLAPSHIFEINKPLQRLPLRVLDGMVVLCVSAIGCPDAFINTVSEVPFPFTLSFICLYLLAWHYLA
jgi:hypothetical protein